LVLALVPRPQPVSVQGAVPAAGQELTLVAEKHAGVETIAADLGESVPFKATWTGKLQKGEYLAILSGKTLVGKPKAASHCSGSDTYDTAESHQYVAELYTKKRVIHKSNVITVEWKDLTLEITPTSDVAGTLTQDANASSPSYHQLHGVPVQLSVRAPDDFATSWKTVEIVDTGNNQVLYRFDPAGAKHYLDNVSTADVLGHEYIAKAFDAAGQQVKVSPTVAIFTRPWNVEVDLSGPKGSSTGDLSVNLGDQVQVTAVIKEPGAQSLAQYANIDIVSNYNGDNPKTEKDCPHAWTCSVPVTRSSEEEVPFTAQVYITDPNAKTEEAGVSDERTVTWAGPPPNAEDYSIEYWISGGSGDCSSPPPSGYSGCDPGPSGTVQLTAQVSFQGHPKQESDKLPFGYSIRWLQHGDQVDMPDCPDRAAICRLTINGPASGSTDFEATMGSRSDPGFVYWTLRLTANWENPPTPLTRRL
jgi:hypothetical protein